MFYINFLLEFRSFNQVRLCGILSGILINILMGNL